MGLSTAFTRLFGVEHPIALAPMGGSAGGALAAAVSRGGGLGLLGGAFGDREWLARELAVLAAEAPGKPWGVGFLSWAIDVGAVEWALERGPTAVMLSFGDPRPFAERVRDAGSTLIIQVTDLEEARRAVDLGADVIVAQGTEAGGHGARRGRSTLPFVPAVVDLVAPVPVLAAGFRKPYRSPYVDSTWFQTSLSGWTRFAGGFQTSAATHLDADGSMAAGVSPSEADLTACSTAASVRAASIAGCAEDGVVRPGARSMAATAANTARSRTALRVIRVRMVNSLVGAGFHLLYVAAPAGCRRGPEGCRHFAPGETEFAMGQATRSLMGVPLGRSGRPPGGDTVAFSTRRPP